LKYLLYAPVCENTPSRMIRMPNAFASAHSARKVVSSPNAGSIAM
jgi:hypothetical protein